MSSVESGSIIHCFMFEFKLIYSINLLEQILFHDAVLLTVVTSCVLKYKGRSLTDLIYLAKADFMYHYDSDNDKVL